MATPARFDELELLRAFVSASARAQSLREYRTAVLDGLASIVRFDAALFHALSPRVALSTAVVRGVDPARVAASLPSWDDLAVALGPMRELASEHIVVTDQDAFPARSRARKVFTERVARPFRQRSLCMVHLIVRARIVSAIALFSRTPSAFSTRDVERLRSLAPVIAIGDALHQRLDQTPAVGAPTRLVCRDQRLTPRQREIVEYVALGRTNAEIAAALSISPNTARNQLARVMTRIDAANRADVVRLAVLTPMEIGPSHAH